LLIIYFVYILRFQKCGLMVQFLTGIGFGVIFFLLSPSSVVLYFIFGK